MTKRNESELHNHAEFVWHIATTAPVNAGTHAVLNAMLLTKKFDSPFIKMYFSTIGRVCGGKDRKDVKSAISKMEELGILIVQGEKVRGRGLANTYEIVDVTGEIPTWDELKRGEGTPVKSAGQKKTLKRGENLPKTGGKSTKNGGKAPPQTSYQYIKEDEDAPRRGELPAADGGDTGANREVSAAELSNILKRHGISTRGLPYASIRYEAIKLGYRVVA